MSGYLAPCLIGDEEGATAKSVQLVQTSNCKLFPQHRHLPRFQLRPALSPTPGLLGSPIDRRPLVSLFSWFRSLRMISSLLHNGR